jgi:signal transduction histidine kinase/CheY-like chemotaxis protein/HPt (histidine-containing phosphotransfer) domain-containing protein
VTNEKGVITGYVTFALNHDHIMELVDYVTPMIERYTQMPSAYEGNYAFIWDYKCRNISHPRHHSIVGYDPQTGDPEVPWLETSIYNAWKESGVEKWTDFIVSQPLFDQQSRNKSPAHELTKAGFVGLDGRYLNNAPQCTGWMDLTERGGSGSFYILWSGIEKLTTAAAIPYYTGKYAPSIANDYSRRGFGLVAIGSSLDDFTRPATETEEKLTDTINAYLIKNMFQLVFSTIVIIALFFIIAIILASYVTKNIRLLINGISRFRKGERQFRFNSTAKDDFGILSNSFDEMADSIENIVNDPVSIIDVDYKIVYMNDYALKAIGRTLYEVIDTSYYNISIYPRHSKYCPITALQEHRESEVLYLEEKGQYYKGIANYLMDHDNNVIGYIIVSNNVTEIEDARRKAEHANHAKSNFLAKMSHEIRTPMNAIIGMTNLALREDVSTSAREHINTIKQASENLLSIINDILDFSKIESGKLEIVLRDFSFSSLLNDVFSIVKMRVMDTQLKFVTKVDCNIPNELYGDEIRIRQVLLNLLSNAVKYTKNGFVSFNVTGKTINEKIVNLKIEVTDSGKGIRQEDLRKLFSEFTQFDLAENKGIEGTGLGLSIARNLVKAMNGEIIARSEYGKGSTFTVVLPQKIRKHEKLASVKNPEQESVIVYERRKEYSDSIIDALNNLGVNNIHVTTEFEFYKKISKQAYTYVFVESALIESVKRICLDVESNARIVLLIEFGETCADKKLFTLTMPIYSLTIANVLNGVENNSYYSMDDSLLIGFTAPAARILVVDDIDTNLKVVEGLLQPYKMQVMVCKSGADAIMEVKSNFFDLVFMDHMMPEMDGIEATARIRALGNKESYYRSMPIIALTANAVYGTKEMFLENGFDDYLSKPINTIKLNTILEKWIQKEKQIVSTGNDETVQTMNNELSKGFEIDGVDIKKGIAMTGGTVEHYLETLAVFNNEGLEKIKEIKTCIEKSDIPLYTTYVHALKSASASIGASEISETAKSLEHAGINNDIIFIEKNNDEFLKKFEVLLNSIRDALSNNVVAGKGVSTEGLSSESIKEKLISLKEALIDMDTITADKMLNEFSMESLENELKETLSKISQSILLCEYDDAVNKIDILIDKTNANNNGS